MKPAIADWFKQAGLAVADIYSICHETDSENTDQMEAFERDTNDGVKIMLAVNMLNEGVHIPRVDAVIMLRTTSSRIIYMQQLGRCLTAANTARPVVLDMVDNISNANVIGNIKAEFETLEQQDYEKDGEYKKTPRQFTITDYTHSIRKVVEKLTEGTARIIPLCERLENIERFVKEHGRLPIESEREAYNDWARLLFYKDREPRVLELMEEYPRFKEESQLAAELTEFIKTHERLPTKGDSTTYKYLGRVFKEKREQWLNDYPELKEQFDKHYRLRDTTNERIAIIIEFYKQHKRFPQTVEEGTKHLQYLYKKGLKDKLNELVEQYRTKEEVKAEPEPPKQRGRSIEELITTVVLFTSEHGRLPKPGDDPKAISAWARLYYREHHPAAEAIFKQYSEASPDKIEERIALVEKFFDEHHHIPWRRDGEAREAWTWIRTRCKHDPRVIAIKSKDKSYQSVNKV
jgi:superfamily II DNA/RNA helicase